MVKRISKNNFRDLLNLATKEFFFTFNNKFHIQVDDVSMRSPLDQILANIFLSHHEQNWLNKCPIEFKPSFNFTVEHENIGLLSFIDVNICAKNGKFVTSVYRKPTFSGVFTNFESFIPMYQKRGLLHTLLHRSFSICCDFKTFHFEIGLFEDCPHEKQLSPKFH